MPKKAHQALVKRANKMGLKGERRRRYIYGTLSKIEKRKKSKK